jgi:putative restriction endonuclease
MAKAIFLHRPDSIYDDDLSSRYDFPRRYLGTVKRTVGDWIVYYEPGKAMGGRGRRAYFAVARVTDVIDNPAAEGRHLASIDPLSFLSFDRPVPQIEDGFVVESGIRAADGRLMRGGKVQSAVRAITDADFQAIVSRGVLANPDPWNVETAPEAHEAGFAEPAAVFERPIEHRLLSRPFRDRAFRQAVLDAYGHTCAMSGLTLRNGGGRPEVEAAHIRPVAHGGPDDVRNGLALSGTLHWMFDRGLVSVADDGAILVSENKVPRDAAARLLVPDRRLRPPRDPRARPHPDFLRHHREHVFGGG